MEEKLKSSFGKILQGEENQKLMVELAIKSKVPKSRRRATRQLLLSD